MHLARKFPQLLLACALCSQISARVQVNPPRRNSGAYVEGRIPEFDGLVQRYIVDINRTKPKNMDKIIKEAKELSKTVSDKEMAEYYIKILSDIQSEGIDLINNERDRLHVILESTKGSEWEYARLQKNVIEEIVDIAADSVMSMVRDMNPNMELWDEFNIDEKTTPHDEI